jgi:phage major head subunit gpT-like protein
MAITDYGVKAALGRALEATPQSDALANLAFKVQSQLPAGDGEKLDFLGMVPALREWVGARAAGKPIEYKATVTLKKFESTIQLPLDWINNDKTGLVQTQIGSLITRYNPQWYGKRVAVLINAAETGTAFDGVAFFASTHAWGDSGTVDNLLEYNAGTADTPTANEAASAIVEAVSAMMGYKDDRGEPINESMSALTIVAPTGAIGAAVMQAVKEKNLDTGTGVRTNPVLGLGLTINVVVSARITVQRMFCINASPGAVPFVFIENTGEFKRSMKGPGSDFEHDNDAWEIGLKAVGEAGYGRFTDATSTQFT